MKAEVPKKKKSRWNKNCMVCQGMKKDKNFRERMFMSKYFKDDGTESMPHVIKSFGNQYKIQTVYACLRYHHGDETMRPATHVLKNGKVVVDRRFKATFDEIEVLPSYATSNHEMGLDDFIAKGRAKLAAGELQLTATTFLQAIKIKMDNDAKTKDRRADMLQGLFKGAAPKRDIDGV